MNQYIQTLEHKVDDILKEMDFIMHEQGMKDLTDYEKEKLWSLLATKIRIKADELCFELSPYKKNEVDNLLVGSDPDKCRKAEALISNVPRWHPFSAMVHHKTLLARGKYNSEAT